MITFIFGNHASGKTTKIFNMISNDAKSFGYSQHAQNFLIVPDQETLQIERLLFSSPNAPSPLNFEVLSFSRLYNRACRKYGGLSYSYITNPIKYLFMWKTVRDLKTKLEKITVKKELPLEDSLISTINELKAGGISSDDLKSEKIANVSSELAQKASDIAKIYDHYTKEINKNYSDSADDLSRLNDLLAKHEFFKDSNVYIDSFTSFTAVQYKIIEKMFAQAKNVTITIPTSYDTLNEIDTKSINQAFTRLERLAKKYGEPNKVNLPDTLDETKNSIFFISKNLWRLDVSKKSDNHNFDSKIVLESCDTPYTEAEAVCVHVRKLLASGERCKDMAIIARDAEKYRGIIDQALTKSNIPFYFSESYDLCSTAAVKFLVSALKINLYNWQKSDVISYLKTGLCDVNQTDKNLFEEYVNTWNIHGTQFLEEHWDMNPDGISAERSLRADEILAAANRVRATIVPPLEKFFILLKSADTVDEMCRHTYAFLVDSNIENKLKNLTTRLAEYNNLKAIRETSQTFEIILNSLADIGIALKGEKASIEEFITILNSVFRKTQINTIPTSVDEITIGSANTLRISNPKYVFVLGLCEGEFPAVVNDSGLLSFTDKKLLADAGIIFDSTADTRSSDELMFVKRSFSAPTEKLYVFTHRLQIDGTLCFKSLAFSRLEVLLGIEAHSFSISDFNYAIPAPKNAAMTLQSIKNPKAKKDLIKALKPYINGIEEASSQDIQTLNESITAKTTVTNDSNTECLHLSHSSFDDYVSCPFNYFCTNILNLRDQKSADFGLDNIGSFIHKILEDVIKYIVNKLKRSESVSDEEITDRIKLSVKSYLASVCPSQLLLSKRLSHLYKRLELQSFLLAKNIIAELSESDFVPEFFELNINAEDGPKSLALTLENGTKVTFGGVIDRIDIYEKDSTVYVKIVDYKTGATKFSLNDLKHGKNTQMLIYLYTICKTESAQFKKLLSSNPNAKIEPAGIFYFSANVTPISANDFPTDEETVEEIQKKIERSGLLLSDNDILLAMNHSLNSKFLLGATQNKKGEIKGNSLASAKRFNEIYSDLEAVIKEITTNLSNGVINATPLKTQNSPCEHCSAKPICRNVQK